MDVGNSWQEKDEEYPQDDGVGCSQDDGVGCSQDDG